jgi:hypothetical protein
MALKDWKLTNKIRTKHIYYDSYVNQKNGENLIIEHASHFTYARKGYSVFLLYSTNRFHKYFKNKKQALKFARDYMRKH